MTTTTKSITATDVELADLRVQKAAFDLYVAYRRAAYGLPIGDPDVDPRVEWERQVKARMAKGKSRTEAIISLMRDHPELRDALDNALFAGGR